jgi:hypothetical protein
MKWRKNIRRSEELCWMFLLGLGLVVTSFAQRTTESSPPNIQIIKLKWEKQMRLPRDFEPSSGSPGTINDSTGSSGGGSGNQARAGGGGSAGATTQGMAPSTPSRVSFVYVYSMKVKNTGPKPIDAVAWDYVLLDPTSHAEIARHQFLSFEKVQSDKTATFEAQQRTPPVRKPKTEEKESDKPAKFAEQAIIQCVLYADETTWRNPNAPETVCDLLKKGKSNLSRGRGNGRPN